MLNLSGQLYVDLGKTILGTGIQSDPWTPEQLGTELNQAIAILGNTEILVFGTKILAAQQQLDWTTPALVSGVSGLTLTFTKKSSVSKCPTIYSDSGDYVERSLVKIGGGNFKTIFSDILVHVRGSLNNTLEGLVEIIGTNEVIVGNDALIGNNLSDFKQSSGCSISQCTSVLSRTGAYFTPVNPVPNSKDRIASNDSYAFVVDETDTIRIYNVITPSAPILLSVNTTALGATPLWDLVLVGNFLLVVGANHILTYDVTNILNGSQTNLPSAISFFNLGFGLNPVRLLADSNGDIFVAVNSGGPMFPNFNQVRKYNISTLIGVTPPVLLGATGFPGTGVAMTLAGNFLVIASQFTQTKIFTNFIYRNSVSITTSPLTVGTTNPFIVYDIAGISNDNNDGGGAVYLATDGGIVAQPFFPGGGVIATLGPTALPDMGPDIQLLSVNVFGTCLIVRTSTQGSTGTLGVYDITARAFPIFKIRNSNTNSLAFGKPFVTATKIYAATIVLTGNSPVFGLYDWTCCSGNAPTCCATGGGFYPLLYSGNTKVYANTLVVASVDPEVLSLPLGIGNINSLVHNQIILGNVAYTFLIKTDTATKAEGNFFFKIAGSDVSVIDIYKTTVLTPQGLVDTGDFSDDEALVNSLGDLVSLNLKYKNPEGIGKGLNALANTAALDGNYPLFSTVANKSAGYFCLEAPEEIEIRLPGNGIYIGPEGRYPRGVFGMPIGKTPASISLYLLRLISSHQRAIIKLFNTKNKIPGTGLPDPDAVLISYEFWLDIGSTYPASLVKKESDWWFAHVASVALKIAVAGNYVSIISRRRIGNNLNNPHQEDEILAVLIPWDTYLNLTT